MPENFDAYRKWLGIPTKDQPPHHYRLLSIEVFESDLDVISNAVDSRTAHIKPFQSGENAVEARMILEEIADAKACLLNAEEKAAYDEQLRRTLKISQRKPALRKAAPLAAASESVEGAPGGEEIPTFESAPTSVASRVPDRSGRMPPWQIAVIVLCIGGAIAILAGLGIYLNRDKEKKVAEGEPAAKKTSDSDTKPKPVDKSTGKTAKPAEGEPKPGAIPGQHKDVPPGYQRVSFESLQPAEGKTELVPKHAKDLEENETKVYIRGFMYPGRQFMGIKQFILVPSISHCKYLPTDLKSTDVVRVKLEGDLTTNYTKDKIGVGGRLAVDESQAATAFGGIPYEISASYIRPALLSGQPPSSTDPRGETPEPPFGGPVAGVDPGGTEVTPPAGTTPGIGETPVQHGLLGEYFADSELTEKIFTRIDPQIQFELGRDRPHPQVPEDFAARWTGCLVAPEPGDYKLSTFVNDGVRLWLDGRLVIERWNDSPGTRDEVDVVLTKGPHAIKIEYYDARNESIMRLNWSRPGVFEEQPVPTEALLVATEPGPAAGFPTGGEPSTPGEPAAVEPPPVKRVAVPDFATRKKTEADVKEIFQEDLAKATTPEAKAAMAQTLYDQAKANADDLNARFVLLQMACDMAAEAGKIDQAMEMIDQMERQYTINPLSVRSYVLTKAAESMPVGSKGLDIGEQVVDKAMALAGQCTAVDNYEGAAGFSSIAMTAARKTKDKTLMQPAMELDREIKRKKTRFGSIRRMLDTLKTNPDDPAANAAAGRYHCFNRDNWAEGLPLLAKGNDPKLAEVAKKDIATPTDPVAQMALGDGWYALAEDAKDEAKPAVRSRAKFYYEQAFPSLAGLEKVKVKKRIEAIDEANEAAAAAAGPAAIKRPERGVVQPGNVALASNGTTVTGVYSGDSYLIDGNTTSGYAYGKYPCQWTITFDKIYRLKGIAFKLHGSSSSKYYYRYAVAISADGVNYVPARNATQGQWRGWQRIPIPNRPVKSVRLFGTYYSYTSKFCVDEFEAYCIIPGSK